MIRRTSRRATVAGVALILISGTSVGLAGSALAAGPNTVVGTQVCSSNTQVALSGSSFEVANGSYVLQVEGLPGAAGLNADVPVTLSGGAFSVTGSADRGSFVVGTTYDWALFSTDGNQVFAAANFTLQRGDCPTPPAPTVRTEALCVNGKTVNGSVTIPMLPSATYQSFVDGQWVSLPAGPVTQPPGPRQYRAVFPWTTTVVGGPWTITMHYAGNVSACTSPKPPATHSPTPTPTGSSAILAVTGPGHVAEQVGLGLVLILLGGAAVGIANRRRGNRAA